MNHFSPHHKVWPWPIRWVVRLLQRSQAQQRKTDAIVKLHQAMLEQRRKHAQSELDSQIRELWLQQVEKEKELHQLAKELRQQGQETRGCSGYVFIIQPLPSSKKPQLMTHVALVSLDGEVDAVLAPSWDAALALLRQRAQTWDWEIDQEIPLDRSRASLEELNKLYAYEMDETTCWVTIATLITPCFVQIQTEHEGGDHE